MNRIVSLKILVSAFYKFNFFDKPSNNGLGLIKADAPVST